MAGALSWLKSVGGLVLLAPLAFGCGGSSDNTTSSAGGAAGSGGSTVGKGGTGGAVGSGGSTVGKGGTGGSGGGTSGKGGTGGSGGGTIGNGGTGGSGGASSGLCQPTDTFAYAGTTYTEAVLVSTDPVPCDAWIYGEFYPNGNLSTTPTIGVAMFWGYSATAAAYYNSFVYLDLYGPAPTSFPATYTLTDTLSTNPGTGDLTLILNDTNTICVASAGTVTLTRFDAVGGKIEGTYTASAVIDGGSISGTCPTSLPQSAFSATRDPDG